MLNDDSIIYETSPRPLLHQERSLTCPLDEFSFASETRFLAPFERSAKSIARSRGSEADLWLSRHRRFVAASNRGEGEEEESSVLSSFSANPSSARWPRFARKTLRDASIAVCVYIDTSCGHTHTTATTHGRIRVRIQILQSVDAFTRNSWCRRLTDPPNEARPPWAWPSLNAVQMECSIASIRVFANLARVPTQIPFSMLSLACHTLIDTLYVFHDNNN